MSASGTGRRKPRSGNWQRSCRKGRRSEMGKLHIAHDAVISEQEKAEAVAMAFLRVEALGGCQGMLKNSEQVVYRDPGRRIHKGPLFVIDSDARTVLIGGTLNDQPHGTQLRVMRPELV